MLYALQMIMLAISCYETAIEQTDSET